MHSGIPRGTLVAYAANSLSLFKVRILSVSWVDTPIWGVTQCSAWGLVGIL